MEVAAAATAIANVAATEVEAAVVAESEEETLTAADRVIKIFNH